MEPNEEQELQETAERAQDRRMQPVAFTMSVLAVLVAIATVLGHRTHTEAVLKQNQATDQWNEYQAKKIRDHDTELAEKVLSRVTVTDAAGVKKDLEDLRAKREKSSAELPELKGKAEEKEAEVEAAELRANRLDLSEALLEIGLVVTSITLLTRRRLYWWLGMGCGAVGVAAAVSALLMH
jgi:Domain of unknown function (DUF4337)